MDVHEAVLGLGRFANTRHVPAARVRNAVGYSAIGQPFSETYSNLANGSSLPMDRTYGSFDAADRIGTIIRPTTTTPITRAHQSDGVCGRGAGESGRSEWTHMRVCLGHLHE